MNIYTQINEIIEAGGKGVLITVTDASSGSPAKTGFKLLLTQTGLLFGTVGGGNLERLAVEEAKKVLQSGVSKSLQYDLQAIGMKCGGGVSLFIDYFSAKTPFVLFGGGHVGQALAPVLELLGYSVTVFDNRPEIIELHGRVENRKALLGDYNDISPVKAELEQGRNCFIASQGHTYDQTVLKQVLALGFDFNYLAMIGSSSKVRSTIERMEKEGLSIPESFYSPAGLTLGGDTAAEIAVSIGAEILAVKYKKDVPHMREKLKEAVKK